MRSRLALLSFLLFPLLLLFRRALFWGESFAFRDTAFYYFPYYQYVRERWSQGVPLWNPLDGLGQPLLGDPTAAVFYLPKLVFCLPLEYTYCFAIYVVGHLLLGGVGAYYLARSLRAERHGALLAGIAYELSGHVLFQYCNPIYLVGAAWLPFGLTCFYGVIQGRRPRPRAVGLSFVLSMMILGGDPQMAMHCVLCGLGACILVVLRRLRNSTGRQAKSSGFAMLGAACLLATLLSAVQILPSQEWATRSDRMMGQDLPRSLPQVGLRYARTGELLVDGLWKRGINRSEHDRKVYHFSVGPWRWTELLWPNISGRFGPRHTRWLRGLPGEGRMWAASLYMGFLPFVLALARGRIRGCSLTVQWITCFTIFSLLAGLGEYGMGWLFDEIRFQTGQEFQPSGVMRGFGGVYWFLTVVVPSYAEFRYPAKWWTITTLGICLLAAKAWPLLWSKHRALIFRRAWVCGLSLLALACAGRFVLAQDVPATAFGPFSESLSLQYFFQSIAQTILVAALVAWLVQKPRQRVLEWSLLGICVAEIAFAQGWMVMTVPEPIVPTATVMNQNARATLWRPEGHQYPASFRTSGSTTRMREALVHDLRTLMPKYHLLTGQRQLNSVSSMRCGDLAGVLELDRADGIDDTARKRLRELFGATAANHRTWLVHDWQKFEPGKNASPAELARGALQDSGLLQDFRNLAIVETDGAIPSPPQNMNRSSQCEILSQETEQLELVTTSSAPALLVLNDQFYPGWSATIENEQGEVDATKIYRVNRVMRGVFVPAGESKITLHYRPRSFLVGAAVSALSWIVLPLLFAKTWLIPRKRGALNLQRLPKR